MIKSIGKKLRYNDKVQISDFDKDNIEPICYLNIFSDRLGNNFGWKEYDMRVNKPLKSDSWKKGWNYHLNFMPKQIEKHLGMDITIIQRVKEFK